MMECAVDQKELIPSSDESWYAVYTIVRHEKSVNSALHKKDINTFLPLRKVINRWKDRKKEVDLPLFPGYIFVNTKIDNKIDILNTRGVVKILGTNGNPVPIPDEQIEFIRVLQDQNLNYESCSYYTEGTEVIVNRGPLEGMSGKIIEKRGDCRLIVSIELIKRSISVEIDIDDIELYR